MCLSLNLSNFAVDFHVTELVRTVLGTGQDESGSWDEAIM